MKFLIVSMMESHPWGGSEYLWAETAMELARRGHDVCVSVKDWNPESPHLRQLEAKGIAVKRRLGRRAGSRRAKLASFLFGGGRDPYGWLSGLLEERNPDLVLISDGAVMLDPLLRTFLASRTTPYVNLSQANSEFLWPDDNQAEIMRDAVSHAKACCFVSQANLRLFQDQIAMPIPNGKVVWNPYGVSRNTPFSWPDEDTLTFACVARLEPSAKGQDLLFQVLSDDKWRSRDFKIMLCGDGPMKVGVARLAKMYGVSGKVEFPGQVPEISAIWERAHALIMPSRYEGLPLAAVEAMMCHRPVIATAVAGLPEIISHGETGFLSAGCTPGALDEAMELAWINRGRLQTMGKAAGEKIRILVPENPASEFADFLINWATP